MRPAVALIAVALASVTLLGQGQMFRSNVDMVVVYPLVTAPGGRLATDLTEQDFTVLDNGSQATITAFSTNRQPITALVLLDMSASMEDRWIRVRDAAVRFVDALAPEDRIRIATFGSEIAVSPHLTGDKGLLTRVLREELWPGGSTPLWTALNAAMQSIGAEPGRRTIVTVTDGVDTTSATQAQAMDRAIRDQFMLYAIGLEGRGLSARLLTLIGQTGGAHFDLKRTDDLGAAFLRFADELRHQYLVGFTPLQLDGRTHSLEIRVNRPGFTVRSTRQFVAPLRKAP